VIRRLSSTLKRIFARPAGDDQQANGLSDAKMKQVACTSHPAPTPVSLPTPLCDTPQPLRELRKAGVFAIGTVIRQIGVEHVNLIGLNGQHFRTGGPNVRITRMPQHGPIVVQDCNARPCLDKSRRPVFGRIFQPDLPNYRFSIMP